MKSELEKYGIQMPAFSKIGGILANELSVDEAACKEAQMSWGGLTHRIVYYMANKCFNDNDTVPTSHLEIIVTLYFEDLIVDYLRNSRPTIFH